MRDIRIRWEDERFCGCYHSDDCTHGGRLRCETHPDDVAMGQIGDFGACAKCLDEDERLGEECKEHPGHPAAQCGPCDFGDTGAIETIASMRVRRVRRAA